MNAITIEIPDLKTVSESNMREHWAKRAKRAKNQRQSAFMHLFGRLREPSASLLPATVTITRIGPRMLDSGGNLGCALKAIQDGIADAFQVDDGDARFTWNYSQEKAKGRNYAVRIHIEPKERP